MFFFVFGQRTWLIWQFVGKIHKKWSFFDWLPWQPNVKREKKKKTKEKRKRDIAKDPMTAILSCCHGYLNVENAVYFVINSTDWEFVDVYFLLACT